MFGKLFSAFTGGSSFNNVQVEEFKNLMKEKDTVILDVRTADEFRGGKIPGAKNINAMSSNFASEIAKLDKSKTYLVYCLSGGRSRTACSAMTNAGFENVYNLQGGISSWTGKLA